MSEIRIVENDQKYIADELAVVDDHSHFDIGQGYRYHTRLSIIIEMLGILLPLVAIYMNYDVKNTLKFIRKRAYKIRVRNARKYKTCMPTNINVNRCVNIEHLMQQRRALTFTDSYQDALLNDMQIKLDIVTTKLAERHKLVETIDARIKLLKTIGVGDGVN